jgi:osmotically inducible lipoprotein OsmB
VRLLALLLRNCRRGRPSLEETANQGDRALSGAGLGAAAGAGTAAITGGNVLTGTVIGGAAGAAAGALTDQDDVDLGEPAWE